MSGGLFRKGKTSPDPRGSPFPLPFATETCPVFCFHIRVFFTSISLTKSFFQKKKLVPPSLSLARPFFFQPDIWKSWPYQSNSSLFFFCFFVLFFSFLSFFFWLFCPACHFFKAHSRSPFSPPLTLFLPPSKSREERKKKKKKKKKKKTCSLWSSYSQLPSPPSFSQIGKTLPPLLLLLEDAEHKGGGRGGWRIEVEGTHERLKHPPKRRIKLQNSNKAFLWGIRKKKKKEKKEKRLRGEWGGFLIENDVLTQHAPPSTPRLPSSQQSTNVISPSSSPLAPPVFYQKSL